MMNMNTSNPAGSPVCSPITAGSGLTSDVQISGVASPEIEIPSLIFAIPFPRSAEVYQATKETPPFLLYTFPRSVYEKPPKDPVTGRRKEKLLKRVERKWQEEVKEGEDIKRGEAKDASVWSRFKGAIIRDAATAIKYMPNNAIEVLGRLPPKTKFGKLTVVYPSSSKSSNGIDVNYQGEDEIEENFVNLLNKACKKAQAQTLISGCLLPFTLAMPNASMIPDLDGILPFEQIQATGAQKARLLSDVDKKNKLKLSSEKSPSSNNVDVQKKTDEVAEDEMEGASSTFSYEVSKPGAFDRTIEHLYNICSELDPLKFPLKDGLPTPTYLPSRNIATALVAIFKESLPEEVMTRHELDEQLAAEDLDRALRKAAKEYVKTIKGINDSDTCVVQEFFSRNIRGMKMNIEGRKMGFSLPQS